MKDANWLCDESLRVVRTVEKVVAQMKGTIEDVHELWNKIKVVLVRALEPYREARAAVMRAIEEEFIPADPG